MDVVQIRQRRAGGPARARNQLVLRGQRKCQRALGYAAAALADGPIGSMCILADRMPLTPEQTLMFYGQGLFPMDFSGELRWQSPDPRSVLPLRDLRVSSRMRALLRRSPFEIRFDRDLEGVLAGCADRAETWLTPRVRGIYLALGAMGAVHTVEAWQDGRLVAGSYGVTIGRVFSGESAFSRVGDAGKIAFIRKAEHLRAQGFDAIDCQEHKAHFARFGAVEMAREDYRRLLARGLAAPASFGAPRPIAASA